MGTSTIIEHAANNRIYRTCLRCRMYVDDKENPDATIYSPEALARFAAIPDEERCRHRRTYVICTNCDGAGRIYKSD